MNNQSIELDLTNRYSKPAKEMSDVELTKWFAFCNAMKFINIGEDMYKTDVPEHDIPYKSICNYVQTVSGDIRECLKINKGIPMKYSLCGTTDEARNVEEISYHIK